VNSRGRKGAIFGKKHKKKIARKAEEKKGKKILYAKDFGQKPDEHRRSSIPRKKRGTDSRGIEGTVRSRSLLRDRTR